VKQDDLDRILSKEQDIAPASGFVDAVMGSVRCEAAVPPPIPFPWKRALPGISGAALALAALCVAVVTFVARGNSGPSSSALSPTLSSATLTSVFEVWKDSSAAWVGLGLVLSFVSVGLAMRLARGVSSDL